jgi:hypothetical protein
MTNDEGDGVGGFFFLVFFFIRHSAFGIRH